jgi:hypothetical protein
MSANDKKIRRIIEEEFKLLPIDYTLTWENAPLNAWTFRHASRTAFGHSTRAIIRAIRRQLAPNTGASFRGKNSCPGASLVSTSQ